MKYIILGAGLSGLTCAAALRRHGHDVCVIEKEGQVGGLARCHREKGYVFDYGPHFLFGPKVCDLIREHFPSILLERVASTREKMFFKERYFNFPFDPKDILRKMDKTKAPAVITELALNRLLPLERRGDIINLEDWVVQAVGRRIYDYISLDGYIKKLYGIPATKVSHEWGLQKLKFLAKWHEANFWTLVLKSLLERKNISKRVIHYPPDGIDHLATQVLRTFEGSGGVVELGAEVFEVELRKQGVRVMCRRNRRKVTWEGDFLVSTIPVPHLVAMLRPEPLRTLKESVNRLRYRSLLLIYFFIKAENVLKDQCVYFTEPSFFFRRITEFKHLRASMAPRGKTSLCVEVTCFEGDPVATMSEQDLVRIIVDQLEGAGYIVRKDVEGHRVLRIPFAYPVYECETSQVLEEVLAGLEDYRQLISVGRQGLFFYNAMNSSMLMSMELGDRLGRSGQSGWDRARESTYEKRLRKYGRNAKGV